MQWDGLDFFFWAAALLGNTALLFVLLYRRRAAEFPFFSALIALNVIRSIVLYGVSRLGGHDSYFWSYWSLGLLDSVLQFAIIYELATLVFRPAGAWAAGIRQRFIWLLAPSIAIALGLSWMAAPPARSWVGAAIARANLCSECLMSELFVITMALSIGAGLPWRTHVAKIAQGLGAYSLVTLLSETAQSYFGVDRAAPRYIVLSHIRMAAYLGCVTYWIASLWADAKTTLPMPDDLKESLFAIQTRLAYDLKVLRSRKKW